MRGKVKDIMIFLNVCNIFAFNYVSQRDENQGKVFFMNNDHLNPFSSIEREYKENYHYLKRFLIKLTRDEFIAEDIIQEVFSKLLKSPDKIYEVNHIRSWLTINAKNALIDYMRKKKPNLLNENDVISELLIDNVDPETTVLNSSTLEEVFKRLTKLDKTIFIAKEYYGYKYDEISTLVSKPTSTIKTRLFRMKKLMIELRKGEDI